MKIYISTFILLLKIITGLTIEKIDQLIIKGIDWSDSIDSSNKNNLIASLGKGKIMKRFICLIIALSVTACASTTAINSEPSGATVFLNGERVGTTPYTHSDTKIIGSTNTVVLKKEGYQDFNTVFSRNENANVGAIIGGVFVLVPFLWAMDYKPNHNYEMLPIKAATKQKTR